MQPTQCPVQDWGLKQSAKCSGWVKRDPTQSYTVVILQSGGKAIFITPRIGWRTNMQSRVGLVCLEHGSVLTFTGLLSGHFSPFLIPFSYVLLGMFRTLLSFEKKQPRSVQTTPFLITFRWKDVREINFLILKIGQAEFHVFHASYTTLAICRKITFSSQQLVGDQCQHLGTGPYVKITQEINKKKPICKSSHLFNDYAM